LKQKNHYLLQILDSYAAADSQDQYFSS